MKCVLHYSHSSLSLQWHFLRWSTNNNLNQLFFLCSPEDLPWTEVFTAIPIICFGYQVSQKAFNSLIKGKLLLSNYENLLAVCYGETGRGSLLGITVCLTINFPNSVHIVSLRQVGRVKSRFLGISGTLAWYCSWSEQNNNDPLSIINNNNNNNNNNKY